MQGRIFEFFEGGGGAGQEFYGGGGSGSSKRQGRGNFRTDKQKNMGGGLNPPNPPYILHWSIRNVESIQR